MNNVSFVMQGPLTLNTLLTIYRYRDDFEMSIVAPVQHSQKRISEEICRIMESGKYRISLYMYDEKIVDKQINTQNRFFHFYSTMMGLRTVTGEFSLKIRNDEFYSDLAPMTQMIKDNPEKIVTNDVFFRKPAKYPFHPSDHLVGGKTVLMLEGFEKAAKTCEDTTLFTSLQIFESAKKIINMDLITPEQQLCLSFFTIMHNKRSIEDFIELMKSTYLIVPCSRLGVYKIMQNHKKESFIDDSYFTPETDVNDIEKYGL